MEIPVGKDKLFTLHFADDETILAEDQLDAEYMLRKLNQEYRKWGLSINPEKPEYLVVGDGNVIINTADYKYLGMEETGNNNDEISRRVEQARAARQLSSVV